jgi:hypothetical protein
MLCDDTVQCVHQGRRMELICRRRRDYQRLEQDVHTLQLMGRYSDVGTQLGGRRMPIERLIDHG